MGKPVFTYSLSSIINIVQDAQCPDGEEIKRWQAILEENMQNVIGSKGKVITVTIVDVFCEDGEFITGVVFR